MCECQTLWSCGCPQDALGVVLWASCSVASSKHGALEQKRSSRMSGAGLAHLAPLAVGHLKRTPLSFWQPNMSSELLASLTSSLASVWSAGRETSRTSGPADWARHTSGCIVLTSHGSSEMFHLTCFTCIWNGRCPLGEYGGGVAIKSWPAPPKALLLQRL